MSRQLLLPSRGGVSLVYAHKITFSVQGNTLTLCIRKKENQEKRGKRGGVGEWSRGSRNRLIGLINKMEFHTVQFVTLTFHRNMLDADEGKKRLRAFTRSLRSKKDVPAGVWKQERQERGALHYHLMLFDAHPIDNEWLAVAWNKASGEDPNDLDHLRYGARVEKSVIAGSADGGLVVSYFTKYIVKEEGNDGYKNGRVWGQWGCGAKLAPRIEKEIDIETVSSTLRGLLSVGGRMFDNDSATGCKFYMGAVGCAPPMADDLAIDDIISLLRESRKQYQ